MSVIYLGIGLVGIWLMRPPAEEDYNPLLALASDSEKGSIISRDSFRKESDSEENTPVAKEKTHQLLLRSISDVNTENIHWLSLTLTCSVPFGIFVAFNYKEYGMIEIGDDQFLTVVGSCGAVFNGIGRLVFGMLLDKFSYRSLSAVINASLLLFAITLPYLVQVRELYLVGVSFVYFAYGGNYSIYPTHTFRVLGNEIGGKIYYLVFIGFSLGMN